MVVERVIECIINTWLENLYFLSKNAVGILGMYDCKRLT